jgi:hypothetical protein
MHSVGVHEGTGHDAIVLMPIENEESADGIRIQGNVVHEHKDIDADIEPQQALGNQRYSTDKFADPTSSAGHFYA